MGRLVVRPVGSAPTKLEPGEQITSQHRVSVDDRKPAPPRFDITVADASEPLQPPKDGYYNIEYLTVQPHPSKLKPGETEEKSELSEWLIEELKSFHETRGVVEDFKHRNPDKMSAWAINEFFLKVRGRSWGVWKQRDDVAGLSLTTGDLIDQKTMLSAWVDHCAIHQWYLTFRKRCLKLCIRYAEDPNLTIDQFQIMKDQITQETIASVPKPEALTTVAKQMHQEAERRPDQLTDLLNKTLATKEALFAAMNDLGETVHGFKKISDDYAKELHAFRSAVILDLGAAKKEMADVRKFFLEKEHVTEIERLREFIQLCERFKELKDSGVLDVITDAILKLEGA